MSTVGPTAIELGISDHNPIVKDGIICWNLWSPGARNGIQSETIERNAMNAVKDLNYPNNVANIVKERLNLEVQYLINLIQVSGKESIDAICLQEVPRNEYEMQVMVYFLSTLNFELAQNGLHEFLAHFDAYNMPISENYIPLMSQTKGDQFGQLTLVNKNKYSLSSSGVRDFPGQIGRILEVNLTAKNPSLGNRKIWNGHLKWYPQPGNDHHHHLKNIVTKAAEEGATLAADTNAPVLTLCEEFDFIAREASFFANAGEPKTANKVLGKPQGEYVDAIITPNTAPHLRGMPQIRKPIPAPYMPPSQPNKRTKAPKQTTTLAPQSNASEPEPVKQIPSPKQTAPLALQSKANSIGKLMVPITLGCGLLAAGMAYYFSLAIVPIALSVSVFMLLTFKIRQQVYENKLAELSSSNNKDLPVFEAGKRAANSWSEYAKSFSLMDLSAWKEFRTFGAGLCEGDKLVDSIDAPDKKLTNTTSP